MFFYFLKINGWCKPSTINFSFIIFTEIRYKNLHFHIKFTSFSLKIAIKKAAAFYLLIHKIDLLIPTALQFGSPFFCRTRSEERRVGKECRSQWAREGYRKKEAEMGRGAWERQSE